MSGDNGRGELLRLRERVQDLEASLRDAELFRSVVSSVPVFIVRLDDEMKMTFVSRVQAGLVMEDVIGRSVFDFIEPEHHATALGAVREAHTTGELVQYDSEGYGPNGNPAFYHTVVTKVVDPSGRASVWSVSSDVTSTVMKDRALAQSEEKLHVALHATKLGLWSWDVATGEVTWDARMRELVGRDDPLDFGGYVDTIVHPDDRDLVRSRGAEALRRGEVEPSPHRVVRNDGAVRWVITVGRVESDASGALRRVMGGTLDVTEERDLEERFRQAQRMEAIGNLTAGIAHNFNNVLASMLPSLDLLEPVVPASHQPILVGAREAGQRASGLVRKLMTFAGHRSPKSLRHCDLEQLIEKIVALCRRTFDRHIEIAYDVARGPIYVAASQSDIEQVMMNLLLNARDAVLEAKRSCPRIVVTVKRCPENEVSISVADNGPGMTEEERRHAFEPFYTTKPIDKGTGLGLSTSYAIVRDLGGTLEIDATPGDGATVTVKLLSPGLVAEEPAPALEKEGRRGAARVLVVDDEPLIRSVVQMALRQHGHQVDVADGGEGAVHAVSHGTFDVILLDQSMPKSPGAQLVPELRALAPSSKIFFFTGQFVGGADRDLVDGVIEKPVSAKALVELIDGVLRDHSAAARNCASV